MDDFAPHSCIEHLKKAENDIFCQIKMEAFDIICLFNCFDFQIEIIQYQGLRDSLDINWGISNGTIRAIEFFQNAQEWQ